jgi:hypothetical protein
MITDLVIACDKREAFAQGSEATNFRPYSITLAFNSASGTKHSSYFPKIR